MTPQERQLVDDLFDRLSRVENAPRDPDAIDAIAQGQRRAPNALYALVQTVLLQDEALKRAHERIQSLESGGEQPAQQGGFLDSMRDALFGGQNQPSQRSSVPPSGRPVWNSGQVLGQPQPGGYGAGGYSQPQPQMAQGQPGQPQAQMGGGGGSFLGTAAAAAAGVVGGGLLMSSIRSMMGGGNHQSFGDSTAMGGDKGGGPWGGSNASGNNDLANQAGLNDIGSRGGDNARQGMFDQASDTSRDSNDKGGNDNGGWFDQASNDDDHDDMGMDDFDDDGGDSDYA